MLSAERGRFGAALAGKNLQKLGILAKQCQSPRLGDKKWCWRIIKPWMSAIPADWLPGNGSGAARPPQPDAPSCMSDKYRGQSLQADWFRQRCFVLLFAALAGGYLPL